MIEIKVSDGQATCKVEGGLSDLLTDARHLCSSLARTMMACGEDAGVPFATLCILQSIFADATTFAMQDIIERCIPTDEENDEDDFVDDTDANSHISSIKIDLKALKEYLKDQHPDEPSDD